ncbi:hypothetical protein [Bacillus sp. E214]|nr:hypothetical protein [Bacillus sp. E214]
MRIWIISLMGNHFRDDYQLNFGSLNEISTQQKAAGAALQLPF